MSIPSLLVAALALALGACGDSAADDDDGGAPADSGADAHDAGPSEDGDAGRMLTDGGEAPDAASPDAGSRLGAAAWIRAHFEDDPSVTGDSTERTRVETPALVHDATACCAKYAFDVVESVAPDDRQIGFVDVVIQDLESSDAFGGGIQTSRAEGATLYLASVTVEPNWPTWVDYSTTNYDGLVLDGASAIYAEDLTVRNWNADGAIDNKATVSQFVRLTIEGRGHRGIRYWREGPHSLVESDLTNEGGLGEGTLLWFQDCSTVELRVYDTTFNGSPNVPESLVSCDEGTDPTIVYLTTDPRTTGELHEMFSH